MEPSPETGQRWAYREGSSAPVVEVEVLRIGTKRPPRVLIRFVDEQFEGREEWVPTGRLKVPWEQAPAWIERQDRWAALRDASWHPDDDAEWLAVELVFDQLVDTELAHLGYNADNGLLTVSDVRAFTSAFDIESSLLTTDPLALAGDNTVVVPWSALVQVSEHLARRRATQLLKHVRREEEEIHRAAVHGRYSGATRRATYLEPEFCAEIDQRYLRSFEVVRRWCGVEANERHDELVALRVEVRRLGHVAEKAITALRSAGRAAEAAKLERELGIPIETLRQSADRQRGRQ